MDKYNYTVLYVVLNNYFRSKRYPVFDDTPCNWKYKNPPDLIKRLKISCSYTYCEKCNFLRKSNKPRTGRDLCIFRYFIDPSRKDRY